VDAALDTYFYFQGDIRVTGKPRLVTSFTWGSEESAFDIRAVEQPTGRGMGREVA